MADECHCTGWNTRRQSRVECESPGRIRGVRHAYEIHEIIVTKNQTPAGLTGAAVEDIHEFAKCLDLPQIHLREPFRIDRIEQMRGQFLS